jgi:hypothetical protein
MLIDESLTTIEISFDPGRGLELTSPLHQIICYFILVFYFYEQIIYRCNGVSCLSEFMFYLRDSFKDVDFQFEDQNSCKERVCFNFVPHTKY